MPSNSFSVLEKILDIATFRHKVLASNIANIETPGYRAKDISFQKELTNAVSGADREKRVFETVSTLPSRDGNTVNIEIEMAKVAENSLTYNTAIQLVGMKIRMFKDVIKGGR